MSRGLPPADRLIRTVAATWPPAAACRSGPWMIRDGAGGGKRVCAATAEDRFDISDLPAAEAAMRNLGQSPLFMIRPGEERLDAILAGRGYTLVDPVNIHVAPLATMTEQYLQPVTTYCVWEPLAIMLDIWSGGGIGPERIAVMHRAPAPRTAILGRTENHPAAVAFAAMNDGVAMVHALEVMHRHRLRGLGRTIITQAAHWALAQGGSHIAAVCTRDNKAANALYSSLGMTVVGTYHYRQNRKGPQ